MLGVLQRLVDGGNTVLVIEHNLDVIKCADWIVDLGPEGGLCPRHGSGQAGRCDRRGGSVSGSVRPRCSDARYGGPDGPAPDRLCAVQPDAWRATTAAMALMSIAGERAAEQAQAQGHGVGTMAALLLDNLQGLPQSEFISRLKLDQG